MKYSAHIHHVCEECGSEFAIHYNDNEVEDDPQLCCFCGAYIIDADAEDTEDDDF